MAVLKAASGVAGAALVAAVISGSGEDDPPTPLPVPRPPIAFAHDKAAPVEDFAARWPRGLPPMVLPLTSDRPVAVYAAQVEPRAQALRRDPVCKHGRRVVYKDRHRYWRCKP
jgi:hypothetical protein